MPTAVDRSLGPILVLNDISGVMARCDCLALARLHAAARPARAA